MQYLEQTQAEERVEKYLNDLEDIYFKFICFYNAKTELHDRTLTDMRSQCDNTEAYVVGENRAYSIHFAISLYIWIKKYIMWYTKQPFSIERWNRVRQNYIYYSAQGWIDVFNYLKDENDEAIIDIEKSWWEYI